MISRTKGIILKTLKYNDNSFIITTLTKDFGKLSFFVKIFGKNTKYLKQIFQPGFIVDFEFIYHQNKDFQKHKNISLNTVYKTITCDISKTSIILLLTEILNNSIKPEHSDENLYEFVENSFKFLDNSISDFVNFHLTFLVKLADFLGFKPENNFDNQHKYFDIINACFCTKKLNEFVLDEKYSLFFQKILDSENFSSADLILKNSERSILLQNIISFFSIHIENLAEIKSLNVLHEVFSN